MDDDLDFEVSSKKKASARRGRRAQGPDTLGLESSPMNDTNDSIAQSRPPPSQGTSEMPTRRVGGWGDEEDVTDSMTSSKSKSARRRGGETVEETVNTRFTNFDADEGSDDNDIPVIPDLEDSVEDTSNQIAIAPSVAVNKVTSYKELDSDLQRTAQFSILDGEVDLKLLTRYLVSEAEATEDDKVWHWDHVFTEIASELQTQWDTNDPDTSTSDVAIAT